MATTYAQAMAAPARTLTARAALTLSTGVQLQLSAGDFLSFTLDEGVSGAFLLGSASSASWTLTLASPNGAWRYGGARLGNRSLSGALAAVEIGVLIDGAFTYQSAGRFIVSEVVSPEGEDTVTLSGLDELAHRFRAEIDDPLVYPQTVSAVLARIRAQAGVPLGGEAQCNADVVLAKKPDWGTGCTLRRALGWTAGALGCFARVSREGLAELAPAWPDAPALTLTSGQMTALTLSPAAFALNRVRVVPRGGQSESVECALVPALLAGADNTLVLEDNALFRAGDSVLPALAQGVLTALTGLTVTPCAFTYYGDPTLRVGDRVTLCDPRGVSHGALVLSQRISWDETGLSARVECDIQTGGVSAARVLTASGTLAGSALCDGVITARHLAAASVTSEKIAAAAVKAGTIETGAITADSGIIADAAITTALIATGAVGTAQIADASITDAKIVGLTANKITAGTINGEVINVSNLNADNIVTGTINGARIPVLGTDKLENGAVTGDKVADDAITADKIVAGAVTAGKLAAEAVTANALAAGAVTAGKLDAAAVDTVNLKAGAVTADKIAALNGPLVITASGSLDVSGGDVTISSGGSLALETEDDADATVNGGAMWHAKNLIVSTVQPGSPKNGYLWVKPNQSTIKTGQWTHEALTSRKFQTPHDIPLTGVALGAGASGSYQYQVSIPIYHSTSNSNSYNVTAYLSASEGGTTINLGTVAFTASGWYTRTVTSPTWLGNAGTIYLRVVLSNANYLSVNSNKAFSLQCTDDAGTGRGWLPCSVSNYYIPEPRVLYELGDQCTGVTGGWRASGGNVGGTVTLGAQAVTVSNVAGGTNNAKLACCLTARAVNVTSYNTLYLRATAAKMASWQGTFGLTSAANPGLSSAGVLQGDLYGVQTYALDINAKTGAYYIFFQTNGVYARSLTADKIWLE